MGRLYADNNHWIYIGVCARKPLRFVYSYLSVDVLFERAIISLGNTLLSFSSAATSANHSSTQSQLVECALCYYHYLSLSLFLSHFLSCWSSHLWPPQSRRRHSLPLSLFLLSCCSVVLLFSVSRRWQDEDIKDTHQQEYRQFKCPVPLSHSFFVSSCVTYNQNLQSSHPFY